MFLFMSSSARALVECGEEFLDVLKFGTFTVCKVAEDDTTEFPFEVSVEGTGSDNGGTLTPNPVLQNAECIDVYTVPSNGEFPADTVTITELVPDGWEVDRICVLNLDWRAGTSSHEFPAGTETIQGQIDANKIGCVAIYSNGLAPFCGDGILDPDEACDDGNDIDDDTCRNDCTPPMCGDGIVDPDEDCDDGNDVDDDTCRNNCTAPICGDGIVDPGEACDDGNLDDGDGCSNQCTVVLADGCRFTGGLNSTFDTDDGENRYTAGGQAGANTALQPQPKGEWTHTNHKGPAGRFTFHGGTASAPEGSEIDEIRCSDPGGCSPSGNPPSPLKQLDFDGVGTFKNIGRGRVKPDFVTDGATVTAEGHGNRAFNGTFHWFEVNIDDLGEPGNSNPNKNPDDSDSGLCPLAGFGEKGAEALANCGCSDFYRITIYDGVKAADVTKNADGSIDPSQLNTTDVIYEVFGYIDGGNLQLHHLTGFDL
jgi:cysteine-rich repeat protein